MEKAGAFLYTTMVVGCYYGLALSPTHDHQIASRLGLGHVPISSTTKVIEGIISNHLTGKRVTLLTEKDSIEGSIITNTLMANLHEPVTLLRLPQEISELEWDSEVDEKPQETNSSKLGGKYFDQFPLSSATVIVGGGDGHWWPFHNLRHKVAPYLVLISLSTPCKKRHLFETPLVSKTTFVVMVCPVMRRKQSSFEIAFRMWCWRPYALGQQEVDLGTLTSEEAFGSTKGIFIDRFDDMTRKVISVSGNPEDVPFFFNKTDGALTGLGYLIMKACASTLKFNFSVTASSNFSWADMLEDVKTGANDVLINYAPMTPDRYTDYDLLWPYHEEGFGLVLLVPPPLPRWKNIIYPFAWTVWLSVVISMMCTAVMYHVIYRKYETSFANNALAVLQCMLSNAMHYIPKEWKFRTFLLIWWIGSWLLHVSYTCNLTAVLTLPVSAKRIQTIQEFVDSDHRLCLLDYGGFVPEALRTSNHSIFSSLGRVLDMVPMDYNLNFVGEESCVEKVLLGTHSHTDGYSYLQFIYNVLGHKTKTYTISERLYPGFLVLLATKNSPWSYKISSNTQRLVETGILAKWYQESMNYFGGGPQREKDSMLQSFSLDHLQGAFYIFLGGLTISTIALFWEFINHP